MKRSPCSFAVFTPTDRMTKKSRGFTFIRYRRQEDADDAIRGMNGRVRSKTCCFLASDGGFCVARILAKCAKLLCDVWPIEVCLCGIHCLCVLAVCLCCCGCSICCVFLSLIRRTLMVLRFW